MAVLRMNSKEFAQYHQRLAQKFKPTLLRGIRSGAQRAVQFLIEQTRLAPPANPAGIGSGGAVNTGAFIREWRSQATSDGAVVTNRNGYGPIIEHGRRAGAKMPPKQAIVEWIKRRLLTSSPKKKGKKQGPRTLSDKHRQIADQKRLEQKKRKLLAGEKHGPKPPPQYGPKQKSHRQVAMDTQAERLSFVIRRAIARRGLIGRKIMTSDTSQRSIREIVRKEMINEIDRELAKK